MREEVQSAAEFLSRLASARWEVSTAESFTEQLNNVLCSHYTDHWFPEKPFKGSAYRCMRIVNQKMDPLISKAGAGCGLSDSDLLRSLPSELTMWVDPEEVSYRIGEDGSIGCLYDSVNGGSDEFSLPSSPSSSASSSPSPNDTGDMSSSSPAMEHPTTISMQSCRDQVTSCFPTAPQEAMSFDRYLAQFVAS